MLAEQVGMCWPFKESSSLKVSFPIAMAQTEHSFSRVAERLAPISGGHILLIERHL